MSNDQEASSKAEGQGSQDSLAEATRSRASFSGHGSSKGAAGHRDESENDYAGSCEFLTEIGNFIAIDPQEGGYDFIKLAVAWDNIAAQKSNMFGKFFKKIRKKGVDLDIGCLYELNDGTRGTLQAFGEKFGSYDAPPFMELSGDERTGDSEGDDESITVNGAHWSEIKRVLVYLYIYDGVSRWDEINPKIEVDIPGENDLIVSLGAEDHTLDLCAVAMIDNVRGGIKLTNLTEYFPGHEEMDRAFGFGLEWDDGSK